MGCAEKIRERLRTPLFSCGLQKQPEIAGALLYLEESLLLDTACTVLTWRTHRTLFSKVSLIPCSLHWDLVVDYCRGVSLIPCNFYLREDQSTQQQRDFLIFIPLASWVLVNVWEVRHLAQKTHTAFTLISDNTIHFSGESYCWTGSPAGPIQTWT